MSRDVKSLLRQPLVVAPMAGGIVQPGQARAALADPGFTATTVTRAFSGRPGRGLVNGFAREHTNAPAAYPEVNNATRPLRAAASRLGDTARMSLWAGQGFREATDRPAGEVVERLCGPG
ncbi:MAG: nitronate monooxygenase [Acidimicrobiales bacterium]